MQKVTVYVDARKLKAQAAKWARAVEEKAGVRVGHEMPKRSDYGSIVQKAGRRGYYVRIQRSGHDRLRKAGNTLRQAREFLNRLRREEFEQDILGVKPVRPVLFRELAKEYLEKAEGDLAASNYPKVRAKVGSVLVPEFGDLYVHRMGADDVQRFLVRRAQRVSAGTRNRDLSILSSMMRYAVELRYARTNPCKGIRRQREAKRAVPFLDVGQQRALVAACEPRIAPIVETALGTGMRQGELLRLEWGDVALDRRVVTVHHSKNGEPRDVPLTAAVTALLSRLKAGRVIPLRGPDRVFSMLPENWNGDLGRLLRDACKAAGLSSLRFHDCRHVAATTMLRAGVPLADVQKIGGWKTATMMLRYAGHSPTNSTDRARDLLDSYVAGAGCSSSSSSP
jgi:integrase